MVRNTRQKDRGFACFVGAIGGLFFAVGLALFLASGVSARFTPVQTVAHVEIGGVSYGAFKAIRDIGDFTGAHQPGDGSFTRVSLRRDFVTDPSLALWAKNTSASRSGLSDIRLIMRTPDGKEVSGYTLKLCKPLSWSIEAAGPSTGGFNEQVDLAVQEISVY